MRTGPRRSQGAQDGTPPQIKRPMWRRSGTRFIGPKRIKPSGIRHSGGPADAFLEIPEKPPRDPPGEICAFSGPPHPPPSWRLFSQKPGKSHFGHFWNRRVLGRKRAYLVISRLNSYYFGSKNAISGKIHLNLPYFSAPRAQKSPKKRQKRPPPVFYRGF